MTFSCVGRVLTNNTRFECAPDVRRKRGTAMFAFLHLLENGSFWQDTRLRKTV